MKIWSYCLIFSSVCFAANPAVTSQAAEAMPTYNYDLYCIQLSGGEFAKNMKCAEKEGLAYAELQKKWASYPEKRKVECHNVSYDENTGKGSYALHLQCIKKGRK